METIQCPQCSSQNPMTAKYCSECGDYLADDQPNALPVAYQKAIQKLEQRLDKKEAFYVVRKQEGYRLFTVSMVWGVVMLFYMLPTIVPHFPFADKFFIALRLVEISTLALASFWIPNATSKITMRAMGLVLLILLILQQFGLF